MNSASHTATLSSTADFASPAHASRPDTVPSILATGETGAKSDITPVLTLVIWSSCLLVGILGFALPYSRPLPPARDPEPIVVEKLLVEMVNDPLPPVIGQVDPLSAPPPPSSVVATQEIAQPIAVAEPSAVAFALPVEGPTTTVAAEQAAHARPSLAANTSSHAPAGLPAPQTLVFGRGEGRQPAPEYPVQAVKLGQEGVVDIRLTVDPAGKVTDTSVARPCAWPMLNDAAERTVRHRWRFSRGSTRVYEVAIRFALAK